MRRSWTFARMSGAIASVAVGAALAWGLLAATAPQPAFAQQSQEKVGKPAADLRATETFQTRAGKLPLVGLRGRTVLLILLGMPTYSARTTEAVPDMNALHDALGPKGLTILGVTPEEPATLKVWMEKNKVKWGCVTVDTKTDEEMKRTWPAGGFPHAYLIDPNGIIQVTEHPQRLSHDALRPYLADAYAPPELPASLADAQKKLDASAWAEAKTLLDAAAAGGKLDKTDAGWAAGVSEWIVKRRSRAFGHAVNLEGQGWWWDAWQVYDDYPRRFAGMEGIDEAKVKADAIRAKAKTDPAVEADLKNGDDFAKALGFLAANNFNNARMISQRLSKLKDSRFAERAAALLEKIPAK